MKNKLVKILILTACACISLPIPTKASITVKTEDPIITQRNEITEIPLVCQQDYQEPYGNYGTIASHGCGIASLSMVASYLKNEFISPVSLAEMFGSYNTPKGSLHSLFADSADDLGLKEPKQVYSAEEAIQAVKDGHPVICLQHTGIFTRSGHFIVITEVDDKGRIFVNDPNEYNWTKLNGFKKGFTEEEIEDGAYCYWIYEEKAK